MKLAIRIFAFGVVVAGFAAAATSNSSHAIANHLSATSSMPAPGGVPGCHCPSQ